MNHPYLRVTHTTAPLDPDIVTSTLPSLYKIRSRSGIGPTSWLNPFKKSRPITFEFLAISGGRGCPVEFYYSAENRLNVLEQRLRSIYPSSFDITRVEFDPLEKLILSKGAGNELEPYGVRWMGRADRRKDWMTTLSKFSDRTANKLSTEDEDTNRAGRAPLASLIDQVTKASHPLAFQVLFKRKRGWSRQARRRSGALLGGRDTLTEQLLSIESPGPRRGLGHGSSTEWRRPIDSRTKWDDSTRYLSEMRDWERDQEVVTRLDLLRENSPARSFTVNARLLAFTAGEDAEDLSALLDDLCHVFDPLDGPYYEIKGERIRSRGLVSVTQKRRALIEQNRFNTRTIAVRRRNRFPKLSNRSECRPDLILNTEELANLIVIPSASDLTVEGSRGTRAEQRSRKPLPRPDHDLTRKLRRPGLDIGYLLDENRDPDEEPVRISPDLLPFHVGRFAKTGAGKSVALINDALSLYENTTGPVFIIDTKGGGLPEQYMRAHAKRFGFGDLEANVLHFDIPEILPGFAFFNIEPSIANGVPRLQAVKDRVDHYEEVLKMTMGAERYEQAVVSPNLLKYLIRLMYDEKYGLEHGLYRESVNYFGQSQLEQVVDQLYSVGPPQADPDEAPRSSTEEVNSKIHRHLTADPRTFANILGGVSHRMDYITADPFLRQIFDSTTPRFDIRDILDLRTVVIFDLGNLRSDAARVMAGVILTNLYDAVTERGSTAVDEEYVVNLLVDEAASIVVSEIFNDLLEKGREFRLSVELVSQFPEQMELEGDREVYLNVLNNIGSPIIGKIAVDDEIARALAHEDMDPVEFRNRVRALPRGEWIAQVPSPDFGQTGPMPFSVAPLPIPSGHPESDVPLSRDEEDRFLEALSRVHERTQSRFGVPPDSQIPTGRVPEALGEALQLTTNGLDELLAVMTRCVQLQRGIHETNGWVSVRTVDDLIETWYESREHIPDLDGDLDRTDHLAPPTRAELAEIRERSPLFELRIDTTLDEAQIRLTESGHTAADRDTGDVSASGGAGHDDALSRVETALTREGYLVVPIRQDGSERPDAWAVHPTPGTAFVIEIETSTFTKPSKVLKNLGRAQSQGVFPVFVVPAGDETSSNGEVAIAQRLENILEDPVKEWTGSGVELYNTTEEIAFNGGAMVDGGVSAVRPAVRDGGSRTNRTHWHVKNGIHVLTDECGNAHARVRDIDQASKEQFPATYSYDQQSGVYTVMVPGELPRSYSTKAEFRSEWVPIKRPFLPNTDLPVPEYGGDSYAILVLREGVTDGNPDEPLVVFEDGELHPFERLEEALIEGLPSPTIPDGDGECLLDESLDEDESEGNSIDTDAVSSATPQPQSMALIDPDSGIERFAEHCLTEAEESVIPFSEVYSEYETFAEANGFEIKAATHFTPVLKESVPVESKRKWLDGKARQCYFGVELVDGLSSSGGEYAD